MIALRLSDLRGFCQIPIELTKLEVERNKNVVLIWTPAMKVKGTAKKNKYGLNIPVCHKYHNVRA